MGTLHELGQPEAPEEGLLLGDDAPGDRGGGRLHDGLGEQVPGQGRQEVQAHTARPRALPHQGDLARVASERGDVVLHPLHGHQLVEHAGVAGNILRVEIEKAKRGHSVLYSHTWGHGQSINEEAAREIDLVLYQCVPMSNYFAITLLEFANHENQIHQKIIK